MSSDTPQTPDVDLPGQQHDQADLDIVVEPEPAAEPETEPARADDPGVTNTLIRPENS